MKINDITKTKELNEGPIWQGLKGAVKGAAQGFKTGTGLFPGIAAGARAGAALGAQQDQNKKIARATVDKWNAYNAQLGGSASPAQTKAWLTKFMGTAPVGTPNYDNPAQVEQWIMTNVEQYIKNKAAGQIAPAATAASTPATPSAGMGSKFAKASQAAPAPAPAAPPVAPGGPAAKGVRLDPKNPADAQVLAKLQAQQAAKATAQATPAAAPTPAPTAAPTPAPTAAATTPGRVEPTLGTNVPAATTPTPGRVEPTLSKPAAPNYAQGYNVATPVAKKPINQIREAGIDDLIAQVAAKPAAAPVTPKKTIPDRITGAGNKVAGAIGGFTQAVQRGAQSQGGATMASAFSQAPSASTASPGSVTQQVGNITQSFTYQQNQWVNVNTGKPVTDPNLISALTAQSKQ